ncbi:flagellar operon protein [Natronincola peptidivorans]|uniref:Flagellar operon protein n=1 Tax=Natronincola peptidivorans TaxID=426128 RepID=A0A1H9YEZ7_9FIRM|nr:TIGR02530 family flagellar biosynthesis protein [Natronincola peptidivorans]SES67515.1 flagellar operon protein [Natronincola peptidivorans]
MVTYKINNKPLLDPKTTQKVNNRNTIGDFNQLLQQHIEKNAELKFSKHATERLQQRNIHLSKQDLSKLNNAIDNAAKKGIKETLIIMDNRAFIASVKNKTVITAAVEDQLKDNVFTNIDGAVII